jgi:hypothetical protein
MERMTREELYQLPAVVKLDLSSRALGMGRTKGQQMAREGRYPVRVLRHGDRYMVSTADLLAYLGIATRVRRGEDVAE